jgi:hypothetical protein
LLLQPFYVKVRIDRFRIDALLFNTTVGGRTMKLTKLVVTAVVGIVSLAGIAPAISQETLTGDSKLACEAILCLSTGQRPDQCTPSIQRYFSISYRRFSDTIRGRINFLNQCPKGGDAQMNTLVQAIAYGAGSCDAATLNATLQYWPEDSNSPVIANSMPDYCAAYYRHSYTNLTTLAPVYAGDRWVPA